jgi:ABC-2 type transport system ATP-binding protein
MSISVSGLTKRYGEQKAVDHVSFEITTGEIVGFLGPNGAGKSTTMKILTGSIQATSGTVKVLGDDVIPENAALRNRIGYLPELNPLYGEMYVKEYLDFIARTHKLKNRKKAVEDVIKTTGLTKEQSKRIQQLSKGYKQRVGLAQALIHNPEVLILDEPTSGLDPNQMLEIRALIQELGKDKTILISSHIMQEIEAMCSRVMIINQGKLVADDNVHTIKERLSGDGKQKIRVVFRNPIEHKNLPESVTLQQGESSLEYIFEAPSAIDLPVTLTQIASDNKTVILEQTKIEESLESVFQKLTKNV